VQVKLHVSAEVGCGRDCAVNYGAVVVHVSGVLGCGRLGIAVAVAEPKILVQRYSYAVCLPCIYGGCNRLFYVPAPAAWRAHAVCLPFKPADIHPDEPEIAPACCLQLFSDNF